MTEDSDDRFFKVTAEGREQVEESLENLQHKAHHVRTMRKLEEEIYHRRYWRVQSIRLLKRLTVQLHCVFCIHRLARISLGLDDDVRIKDNL